MTIGPHVRRLIAHRMSCTIIPKGGGLQAAVSALASKETILLHARQAQTWVEQALAVLRTSPDLQPGMTDEELARMILSKVDERKGHRNRLIPNP